MTHTETAERAEDVPASQAARTAMREAGEPDPEEEVPEDDAEDARDRIWQRSY